jgi:hypothetical protein
MVKKTVAQEPKTAVLTEDSPIVEPEAKKEDTTSPLHIPQLDDIVNVTVIIGSLNFELGTFEFGEVFQVTRERALRFEPITVSITDA